MADEWGFSVLKNRLLEKKEYFSDKDFPPTLKSITVSGVLTKDLPVSKIIWKRPKDIVETPYFVKSSASRSDLDQGLLGDCWFIAAASSLANGPKEHFEKCVPVGQSFNENEYAGIFHFYFWDYGIWTEVIIDDLLPTDGTSLIFCHNQEDKDEFWGALLEKAYAKHKGLCYEDISGGKFGSALVDFTGGLSELIYLSNPKIQVPQNLYNVLRKTVAMDSFIGASIYQNTKEFGRETRLPNGLYQGHAYSVNDVNEVVVNSTVIRLLRLRNPHGKNEWNGAWSDNSNEMKNLPNDVMAKLKAVSKDDGEFWMSYEDFLSNFDEICLCHLLPGSVNKDISVGNVKQNWRVTEYHDAWINGITAGGCGNPPHQNLYWKNPQFQIQLIDPDNRDSSTLGTMIVSLMEKEILIDMNDVTIGFDIFEIRDPQKQPINGDMLPKSALKYVARSGAYQGYREVVRRFELNAGYYVIVPSTFYPFKEAKFLLRIYTEMPVVSEVLDENNVPAKTVKDGMSVAVKLVNDVKTLSPNIRKNSSASIRELSSAEQRLSIWKSLKYTIWEWVKWPLQGYSTEHLQLDNMIGLAEECLENITEKEDIPRHELAGAEQPATSELFTKHAGDDGKMDHKELKSFLEEATAKDAGSPISFQEETCRSLLVLMDKDRSGFLDMSEAHQAFKEIMAYMAVFKQFDKDQSNAVDIIELGTMFKKLGFPVSRSVLLSIIRRYGGRNRQITVEDFIISICKLTTMYFVFVDRQKRVAGPDDVAVFTRNEFLEHTMFC